MQTGSEIITLPNTSDDETLEDLFASLEPLRPADIKKSQIAVDLAALLVCAKINRTALAQKLHWKKSRVTKVLSGESNSTIETIWDVVSAAGFDFDLVFRSPQEAKPAQPWEREIAPSKFEQTLPPPVTFAIEIKIQNARQVANDLMVGDGCDYYVGLSHRDKTAVVPRQLEKTEAPTIIPDRQIIKSATVMIHK